MQISGIYGMNQSMNIPLNEEQKSLLDEIMDKYDPENMSREDMKSMRQEIKDAGIPQSKDTMQMLHSAGFKPKPRDTEMNLMDTLGMGQEQSEKGEMWDLYQQLQSGQITEQEFLEKIQGQSLGSGSLINLLS